MAQKEYNYLGDVMFLILNINLHSHIVLVVACYKVVNYTMH
jgi:hypothetical protein